MDGLSVAANIMAVVSAAQLAAQGLQKLYSLRKAPQQVLLLLGEVSDLQTVLSLVQDTSKQLLLCNQFQDPIFNQHLAGTIQKTLDVLNEVNGVIDSGLIKNLDQMSNERMKISWKMWLRKHGYLRSVSSRLRNVRTDIASVLTLLTASEVPRLRNSLSQMLQDNQLMVQSLQSSEREIAHFSSTLEKVQGTLELLQPKPSTELCQTSQPQFQSRPRYIPSLNYPQTGFNSKLCICRCHEPKTFNSPRWTESLFGQLVIAYSGMALSDCNIASCQEWKSKQTVFRATYYFPPWLLQRVIVFCDRWSSPMGHAMSIRTPRILPWGPRFYAASSGRTQSLQKLFVDGEGSPFDTNEDGRKSLLSFAVTYKMVETCRFLLQNHADPEQQDASARSPLDELAEHLIMDPLNPIHIELKQIFSPFFDINECLGKRKFSDLHKIVLGLTPSPIDLEAYLQLSTANIESRCSLGRTPLLWASASSNTRAIEILLKHGARIDSVDDRGLTVFHQTGEDYTADTTEALSVLLEAAISQDLRSDSLRIEKHIRPTENPTCNLSSKLLEELVNKPDVNYWRPIDCACFYNKPKQIALLLSHNVSPEPDPSFPSSLPSIFLAIDRNSHEALELLLKAGTKTDTKDHLKKSILHIAAEDGDLKTLRILSRANPPIAIETRDLDIFGLTPMEQFEKHSDNFESQDEVYRARRMKAFTELLEQSEKLYLENHCQGRIRELESHELIDVNNDKLQDETDASNSNSFKQSDDGQAFFDVDINENRLRDGNDPAPSNESECSDDNEMFFDASSDPEIDI